MGRRGKGWKVGSGEGMDGLFAPLFPRSWIGDMQVFIDMTRKKLLMIKKDFELPLNGMVLLGVVLILEMVSMMSRLPT